MSAPATNHQTGYRDRDVCVGGVCRWAGGGGEGVGGGGGTTSLSFVRRSGVGVIFRFLRSQGFKHKENTE